MKQQKVAIVGSHGFIGRHSAKQLVDNDIEVQNFGSNERLTLLNENFWQESRFDSVLWLASKVNPLIASKNPNLVEEERDYFLKVIKSMVKSDSRLIFASSGGAVYSKGSPPYTEESEASGYNEYGKLKADLESIIFESAVNFTILRLSNAYGLDQVSANGQAVIASWLSMIQRNEPLAIFGDMHITRDFIYISDVTSAITQVVEKQLVNEVLNIGSGFGTSLETLIETMQDVTGRKVDYTLVQNRQIDRKEVWLDIRKATRLLDWQPAISLNEGISRTWQAMNLKGAN